MMKARVKAIEKAEEGMLDEQANLSANLEREVQRISKASIVMHNESPPVAGLLRQVVDMGRRHPHRGRDNRNRPVWMLGWLH